MPTVSVEANQCARPACGHIWYSRNMTKPSRCAKCKSPYWDRLYVVEHKETTRSVPILEDALKRKAESIQVEQFSETTQ